MKLVEEVKTLAPSKAYRLLRAACMLSMVGLAMMMWSLFDPTPAPVLLALSFGQLAGTLSFAIFLAIVGWDVYRKWQARSLPSGPA